MEKRGQLGIIEFKYFIVGLFIGIIVALILAFLGSSGVLPFTMPGWMTVHRNGENLKMIMKTTGQEPVHHLHKPNLIRNRERK